MAKIVAIICEYNPFHNGHKYQIDKIRKQVPDAIIACIMSGNVTQRGEFALLDKYTRAKIAVLNGANVVFEMPFPYSSSNAEVFALTGVKMANQIGADYLCFGVETDKISELEEIARTIDSKEFEMEMQAVLENKSISYLSAKEEALSRLGKSIFKNSNDMLAIEYLRAISAIKSDIVPLPIKRRGCAYHDLDVSDMMSASGIREFFFLTNRFISVPESSSSVYKNEIASGAILDKELAQRFLYMSILRSSPEKISNAFDCPEGCGYFIYDLAKKSESADQFFKNLSSKSYTFARLRRVVMNLVFGVENVSKDIGFTTLLCSDKNGCELLKSIRKSEKIKVITKQSDAKNLKDDDMLSFKLGRGVDEAFYALLKKSQPPDTAYKKSAIII